MNVYRYLFEKQSNNYTYEFSTGKSVSYEFFTIRKYPITYTNNFLSAVWSQPRNLIGGQMVVESSNYTHAISTSYAMGILQIKQITAEDLFVENLFDPYDNLKGALEYHGYLRRLFNDERKQIVAYHDGPTAVLNHGVSEIGERYYQRVKDAQKNYANRPIYSPYFLGLNVNFVENLINTTLFGGIAYRKIEFYSDFVFSIVNISDNNGIIDNDRNILFENDYNFTLLYSPLTYFTFGMSLDNIILRLGFPWESIIIEAGNNPKISYTKISNRFFINHIEISNNKFMFGMGFRINNFDLFAKYEFINHDFDFHIRFF